MLDGKSYVPPEFPQTRKNSCRPAHGPPSSPHVKTLILWDIDGTLIQSGGAGERALITALLEEFGIAGTLEDIEIAGRTDPWIARRVLAKFALPETSEN